MKKLVTDVLIIGSGGAGLRCAIELHDKKVNVLVVGKCAKRDAHTILATGGINAALGNMDPQDSWQLHAADTIKDGGMINDPTAVEILCKNAPRAVQELNRWGTTFHKEKNGKITQRFFGAATYRRACFVGDHTGRAILNTLVDQTVKRKIPFKSNLYIFSLIKKKVQGKQKVIGAVGLDIKTGNYIAISAKIVVLATGGHSRMFKRSSSRFWENNGDGIHLAKQVGCDFMDMEMFQFHPTGMVWPPQAEGVLVTEAVRGEGGILTNSKGQRFMNTYDPQRMELSARDVVARANYHEITQGRGTKKGGVYLDISHKPKSYILKRLPLMYKQFKTYAHIDISKQKMEVAPTAHYSMGGIHIDHTTGKTKVNNLYAIGEVTSGVHGGNRLGGNSLAEITVFGRLTGLQIVKDLKKTRHYPLREEEVEQQTKKIDGLLGKKGKNPLTVKKEIQQLMWKGAGVDRTKKSLQQAQKKLQTYKHIRFQISKNKKMNKTLIAALDVHNMIPTCDMILASCLKRTESRAAHYRSDYPKTKKSWEKNIICKTTPRGFTLTTKKRKPLPRYIRKLFNTKKSKKLLE